MKNKSPQHRGLLLYQNLFADKQLDVILKLLSEGLSVLTKNADSLLEDAQILADARRYSRADFLAVTAAEEIAKNYILLDMCRLDFKKKGETLKRLCCAFYNHIKKHAYYKVTAFDSDCRFSNMTQIKEKFQIELVPWWPTHDIESGEPDMPHEVYFRRELNLYVDFSDYDRNWIVATPEVSALQFEIFKSSNPILSCRKVLNNLLDTLNEGLYRPGILGIFNEIFRRETITEKTSINQLIDIYEGIAKRIENLFGIKKEKFEKSVLKGFPLYNFLLDDKLEHFSKA